MIKVNKWIDNSDILTYSTHEKKKSIKELQLTRVNLNLVI